MQVFHKKAFTMIELIFVIVIIGILSALAIPKLSATRDDAQLVYVLANTRQLIHDVNAYYISQGPSNFKEATSQQITDVPISTDSECDPIGSGTRAFYISTLHLCVNGVSILTITTGNKFDTTYKMTLAANNQNTFMGKILQNSKVFQSFTNGISGKEYIINGGKVNRN